MAKKRLASSASDLLKQLPSEEKILFLLSDDIRQETGSKLTILGFIPSNEIFIDPKVVEEAKRLKKRVAFPLVILFCILGGNGKFMGRMGLVAPDGKEIWSGEPSQMSVSPRVPRTVALKLMAMEAIEGEYTARLRIDEREYVRHFRVTIGDPPATTDDESPRPKRRKTAMKEDMTKDERPRRGSIERPRKG